jgi:nickel/cobalt transporter (NicO) family protein
MNFSDLLQQGAASAWFFFPTAILLGALHGLEPGHSKTMMAAFIVAVRGTVGQAILLALAATISHTAIVWAVAILALTYGDQWGAETTEPYFQIASAVIIIGIAAGMALRTWGDQRRQKLPLHLHERDQGPGLDHAHGHDHTHDHGHSHPHGQRHAHEHGLGHAHSYGHLHTYAHPQHDDAHSRAHASELERRFGGRTATTGQVILFGLTGGLIPCPGAVTVAFLCLQVQRFSLGIVLVICFSIGLALTLVASGIVASFGMRHVSRRWSGLDAFIRRLPYLSSAIVICVGLYVGYMGIAG